MDDKRFYNKQYSNRNNEMELKLPSDFKAFVLIDEKGNITDKLFSDIAENISKSFVNDDERNKKGVSARQIRKIFDEMKCYDSKLSSDSEKWKEIKPYIQMIKSKVAYAVARAKDKASKDKATCRGYDNFMSFMNCGLKQTNSVDEYHIFVCLFEAVYGFYYQIKPNNN